MIRFPCQCGRMLQAREDDVGKKARCPSCGVLRTVPSEEAALRPAPPRPEPEPPERRRGHDDDRDRPRRRPRKEDEEVADETSGKAIASLVLSFVSFLVL